MFTEKLSQIHDEMASVRQKAIDALEAIETEENPSDSFVTEKHQEHDRWMEDFEKLEKQAERYQRHIDAEARMVDSPSEVVPATEEPQNSEEEFETDEARYEAYFDRIVRYGESNLNEEELRFVNQRQPGYSEEGRAQSATTENKGGYLVPETTIAMVETAMEHRCPFFNDQYFRILRTADGHKFNWPTVDDTANDGALIAESTDESEQDVTFGEVEFDAYKYTSKMIKVPYELLQDSVVPVSQILSELLAERVGRALSTVFTNGDGSSKPKGIVTCSTAAKTTASATALKAEELMDVQASLDDAYEGVPSVAWMMNKLICNYVQKIKDSDGNFIWRMKDIRNQIPNMLLGAPVIVNPAMDGTVASTKKTAIYGDMKRFVVRMAGPNRLTRLNERYAEADQVAFIYRGRADSDCVLPAAIRRLTQKT